MLLEVKNLSKSFKRHAGSFSPVDDLSFSMGDGELVVISGRSGSGKTTFLNLISRLIRADSGEIIFKGKNIVDLSAEESSVYRNQEIGYLVQHPTLLKSLNVIENVMFPFYLIGNREGSPVEKARTILEEMNIDYLMNSLIETLSGGELKRVALARTLINQPDLLLIDEPTSDLDEETARDMIKYLQRINKQGTAMIVVSHDKEVLALDENQLVFKDGQLLLPIVN